MYDQILDMLKTNRELMRTNWCKKELTRTKTGEPCGYYSPNASKFCSLGGLMVLEYRGCFILSHTEAYQYLRKASKGNPTRTNDKGKKYAIAMHDEAIVLREKDLGLR